MGSWGRNWATEVVPQIAEVQLVGCVDVAPQALTEVVKSGIARRDQCYRSLAVALRDTGPDAVLVTSDLTSHVAAVRAALEAGKPVLCEKPFAPSMAEGRDLVQLASELGLTLMVSQNYRFYPAVRAVQKIVVGGALGALVHMAVDFRRYSVGLPGTGHRAWAHPLLLDMSVHHFDLMRAVSGQEPRQVYCRAWNPGWAGFADPPEGTATINFDDGLVVSYRASWTCLVAPTPWAGEWRMEFERGELWWASRGDNMTADDDVVRLYRRDGPREGEPVALPALSALDRAGALAQFVASLGQKAGPETSAQDNLGTLALVFAAIGSAARGEPVRVAT
jgi:predicted dehydrogenase